MPMWRLGPDRLDEPALAAAWRAATPFPHLVFDDVVEPARLAEVLAIVDDEPVLTYEAELFAFDATAPEPTTDGFRALRAGFAAALAPALSRITGKAVTRVDMRGFAYRPGHYLLPHTDHQDGLTPDRRSGRGSPVAGGPGFPPAPTDRSTAWATRAQAGSRALAYAWYLSSPEPPVGGELELYRCEHDGLALTVTEPARLIEPVANRLAVFDVSDVSLHQVREVLAGLRISLAGWFYP